MEVALRKRASTLSLAQRRAAFEAQMREMAVSELTDVSQRLKGLHRELEELDGRRWTHYDLAAKMGIPPRTFQSWENGEVENRNGQGYDKMARFYARKLGRKITRQWILFGDEEKKATPMPENDPISELSEAVESLRHEVRDLRAQVTKSLARRAEADKRQASKHTTSKRPLQSQTTKRK